MVSRKTHPDCHRRLKYEQTKKRREWFREQADARLKAAERNNLAPEQRLQREAAIVAKLNKDMTDEQREKVKAAKKRDIKMDRECKAALAKRMATDEEYYHYNSNVEEEQEPNNNNNNNSDLTLQSKQLPSEVGARGDEWQQVRSTKAPTAPRAMMMMRNNSNPNKPKLRMDHKSDMEQEQEQEEELNSNSDLPLRSKQQQLFEGSVRDEWQQVRSTKAPTGPRAMTRNNNNANNLNPEKLRLRMDRIRAFGLPASVQQRKSSPSTTEDTGYAADNEDDGGGDDDGGGPSEYYQHMPPPSAFGPRAKTTFSPVAPAFSPSHYRSPYGSSFNPSPIAAEFSPSIFDFNSFVAANSRSSRRSSVSSSTSGTSVGSWTDDDKFIHKFKK